MAKSAVFVFFSPYFKQKIVGWYASMQKFELKLDQFGAFRAAWCQEVRKFPVKVIPLKKEYLEFSKTWSSS